MATSTNESSFRIPPPPTEGVIKSAENSSAETLPLSDVNRARQTVEHVLKLVPLTESKSSDADKTQTVAASVTADKSGGAETPTSSESYAEALANVTQICDRLNAQRHYRVEVGMAA